MAESLDIAGRGLLRIDSKVYNCEAITVRIGNEVVTKKVGMNGVAGDVTEFRAPSLTATIIVTSDVSIHTLSKYRNVEAEVEYPGGRAFVFEGASTSGEPPEHDGAAGTCEITMESMTGREVGV